MIISRLFKHKGSFLALLVLLFLTTVLFREYLWGGKVPFPANLLVSFYSPWRQYEWEGYPNGPPNKPIGFDNLRLFYPYRKLITEQLKKGEWPFWNPYNFSGNIGSLGQCHHLAKNELLQLIYRYVVTGNQLRDYYFAQRYGG